MIDDFLERNRKTDFQRTQTSNDIKFYDELGNNN